MRIVQTTKRPTWCVWAMICDDCDGITASIYPSAMVIAELWERHLSDANNDSADDNQILRIGDDWRNLLVEAALELLRQTGCLVCDCCAIALTRSEARDEQLTAEANELLHWLLVELTIAVQQVTVNERRELGAGARVLEFRPRAAEPGISQAEPRRRMADVAYFDSTVPSRLHAFKEAIARRFPDGPPPDAGWSEQQRQDILDHIVRPYQRRPT